MLGINLIFAGFALSLNGLSYFVTVDERARSLVNVFVGAIIAINAIMQTQIAIESSTHTAFGFAAATWLFAINYFVIAAHIHFKSNNWKVFGLYSVFASAIALSFAIDNLLTSGPAVMLYLWLMWAILWAQSGLAIMTGLKVVDRLTPYVLLANGIASTFVPGILMVHGMIL